MDGTAGMETAAPNKPRAGEFFILEAGRVSGPANGVVFENLPQLLSPPRLILRPEGGGFPPLKETPLLVYTPSKGPPPLDLEPGFSGYWLVSERLQQVMNAVDPNAFAFAEVDYRLADGSRVGRATIFAMWSKRSTRWMRKHPSSSSTKANPSSTASSTT